MNRWIGLALMLLMLGALALRLPQLNVRPMHNDEAVNAIKLRVLWEEGTYHYDPQEYHGPVLYYASLPVLWLSGAKDFAQITETTLRWVPVLFGVGSILLLGLLADGLGRAGTIFAGLLTALSPAMNFYSRYFIHEMLLVFFTLLLLGAGWRYTRKPHLGWAVLCGIAVGFMYATKETFVLPLAAMAGAIVLTISWRACWIGRTFSHEPAIHTATSLPPQPSAFTTCLHQSILGFWNWKHALAALLAAVTISILFFSSFFTNASGPFDAVRTYVAYLQRAKGISAHLHPWYFYLERLLWFHQGRGPVWSEGIILLLGGLGFVVALRKANLPHGKASLICFLGFYTVLLTGAVSLIPYKTPWCFLGFWHGVILLAGTGVVVLLNWPKRRKLKAGCGAMLVFATAHLLWQAWQASYVRCADARNPYNYSPTSPDLIELVEKIQALGKAHPQGNAMPIKVMAPNGDYWPLPWYLRQFRQIDWQNLLPSAPVIIAGLGKPAGWEESIAGSHLKIDIFSLRSRVFLELYVENTLWERYMATKPQKHPPR